jgi:hypothetical protein
MKSGIVRRLLTKNYLPPRKLQRGGGDVRTNGPKINCDGVGVSMKTQVTLLCCTHENKTKTNCLSRGRCVEKTSHTNHAVCTIKCTPCDEGVGASNRTSRTVRAVCTMRTKSVHHVGDASQKTSHIDSAVCTINCSTRVRGCSGVVDF